MTPSLCVIVKLQSKIPYIHTHICSNYGTCQPTVEDQTLIVQPELCAYFHHSNCNTATLPMVHPVTFSTGFIKNETRYNQMIVAIVDVLTSFDVVTNDNR